VAILFDSHSRVARIYIAGKHADVGSAFWMLRLSRGQRMHKRTTLTRAFVRYMFQPWRDLFYHRYECLERPAYAVDVPLFVTR